MISFQELGQAVQFYAACIETRPGAIHAERSRQLWLGSHLVERARVEGALENTQRIERAAERRAKSPAG